MFHPALFAVVLLPGVGLIVEELRARRGIPGLGVFMVAIGLFGLGMGVAEFMSVIGG